MATTDSKGSIIAKDLAVIIIILLPSPGPCCRVGPGSGPVHAATDGNSHQCHYSASDCSICNDNTSENFNKWWQSCIFINIYTLNIHLQLLQPINWRQLHLYSHRHIPSHLMMGLVPPKENIWTMGAEYYRRNALPVAQPTVSKQCEEMKALTTTWENHLRDLILSQFRHWILRDTHYASAPLQQPTKIKWNWVYLAIKRYFLSEAVKPLLSNLVRCPHWYHPHTTQTSVAFDSTVSWPSF